MKSKKIKYLYFLIFLLFFPSLKAKKNETSFIRITKKGGFSPYTEIVYDLTIRGKNAIITHSKELVCFKEDFQKVGFIEKEVGLKLLKLFEEKNLFSLKKEKIEKGEGYFEVWASIKDKYIRVEIPSIKLKNNENFNSFFNELKKNIIERVGEIPFRNVYYQPEKIGYLTVMTDVKAKVISIDDREVHLSTPLHSYEMPAGEHKIKIARKKGKKEKEFIITIEPGITTIIETTIKD